MAIIRRTRNALVLAALVAVVGHARTATAAELGATVPRIRSSSPRIQELVREATERSQTFRAILEKIQASDGVVYIEHGKCPNHARSCLLHTMTANEHMRLLRVNINASCTDRDLIGLLGHELQHVTEVLGERSVRSGPAMTLMYHRKGIWKGGMFETEQAVAAGQAVRKEAWASRKAQGRQPLLQLALEPGLGQLPVAHDGVDGHVEDVRGLLDAQPAEEPQLDDTSLAVVEF
jgi:hypothetical protein